MSLPHHWGHLENIRDGLQVTGLEFILGTYDRKRNKIARSPRNFKEGTVSHFVRVLPRSHSRRTDKLKRQGLYD